MKLRDIIMIRGKIILETGLRIGGGDMEMRIGGVDNPVIKHPHTQEPYIPGSSLKGKVLSLLEMRSGLMIRTDGWPLSSNILRDEGESKLNEDQKSECKKILQLFGISGADSTDGKDPLIREIGPTRVSFSDARLNEEWMKGALGQGWSLTEVKSENRINRISGTAKDPRFTERVSRAMVIDHLGGVRGQLI
ncbi:MAG: type III-A CRISPR-associated RAMP protein Csm3 [Deltaproteobacteria bacterium]|nr:type III-A CRISPR-associated RAMP protein Csm3 [Deltaproteobacteria bacterium]